MVLRMRWYFASFVFVVKIGIPLHSFDLGFEVSIGYGRLGLNMLVICPRTIV